MPLTLLQLKNIIEKLPAYQQNLLAIFIDNNEGNFFNMETLSFASEFDGLIENHPFIAITQMESLAITEIWEII